MKKSWSQNLVAEYWPSMQVALGLVSSILVGKDKDKEPRVAQWQDLIHSTGKVLI